MSIKRYITGFILSLMITALSFGAVWAHMASNHQLLSHAVLAASILVFAIVQLVVQLIYFIHLGRESKARQILPLILAASLIAFVVGGTLWIMANLANNHEVPYSGDIAPQTSTD